MAGKGRIFICGDVSFPRGDAGAGIIHYLSKALIFAGKDSIIISCGKNDPKYLADDGFYYFEGIKYCNVDVTNDTGIKKILREKLFSGKNILEKLDSYNPTKDDVVLVYGSNSLFVNEFVKYCRKKNIKMYLSVVEWHQPEQYSYGKYDPRFIASNTTYTKLGPKIKNIIAISKCIYDYYNERNCNVIIVPAMTDKDEHPVNIKIADENVVNLVYPGMPFKKENVIAMFEGLAALPDEYKSRVKFHSTGVSEQYMRDGLGDKAYLYDQLKDMVVIHGKVDYDELVEIYSNMDFLYLCRNDNLVTKANFPNKIPELMSWGVAPIGNKIGDYYEYLSDGENAIIFEENDAKGCTKAVMRAVDMSAEDRLAMKNATRKCAEDNFDYRSWSKKIGDFVNNER